MENADYHINTARVLAVMSQLAQTQQEIHGARVCSLVYEIHHVTAKENTVGWVVLLQHARIQPTASDPL